MQDAVHELEKRITCHDNEVAITHDDHRWSANIILTSFGTPSLTADNACVSCASLYKNASTCTRSAPLTCTYGAVNSTRNCAPVDCTKLPGTYRTDDAKQCLACPDAPNGALTCNSTATFSCLPGYDFHGGQCYLGVPIAKFVGYGLAKPFLAKQQPFKPYLLTDTVHMYCLAQHPSARVAAQTGFNSPMRPTCSGQIGAIDQPLVVMDDHSAAVFLRGWCEDLSTNPYVTANRANSSCVQSHLLPDGFASLP
ncbi:BZ3500_MvSof-1268-A1-R1_Chr12-3g04046 [Microbotryum saponariae]|uniref:BZ3500_MvSof-1268-A1-R1_Chr12-3g04046 protein n=1 Tax=Microbotryum saponariae TaxID=289078 RepID=A0A2X0KR88_9BASI|nr:BZ3500_MvSof-1268-A1-R1_Chr12-3g04046 [Microbotryum saponariae]SDA02597.1 BZ3501_MvSof-1269-A2-R1_Chr12-3g03701 [Microbotryum saponariae]